MSQLSRNTAWRSIWQSREYPHFDTVWPPPPFEKSWQRPWFNGWYSLFYALREHLSSKTDDSTTSHLRQQTSWWRHLSSINLSRAHLGLPHLCGLIWLVSGQHSKIFELIHFPLMPPSISAKYCDRNKQTFIVLSDDPLNNQSPLVHNVHTGPWRTTRTKKRIYRSWLGCIRKNKALRIIPESAGKQMCQVQNQLNIHTIYIEDCNVEWNGFSSYKRNIQ